MCSKGSDRHISTILLADDHPLVRFGLSEIIQRYTQFHIVAEANDGARALELIEQHRPTVAILDIDMPKMNGLQVAKHIFDHKIPTDVIILTMHDEPDLFEQAMDVGVMGYVLKDSAESEISAAIQSVYRGKHYISPTLTDVLLRHSDQHKKADEQKLGHSVLTQAERIVLKLVAESKTTKEIADQLFVSERTVESHRSSICTKLDLHGPNALLRYALEFKDRI